MFTSGMNPYLGEYFSIVTVIITVPFAVLALNLVASLWRAQIRLRTPMLFALGIIVWIWRAVLTRVPSPAGAGHGGARAAQPEVRS